MAEKHRPPPVKTNPDFLTLPTTSAITPDSPRRSARLSPKASPTGSPSLKPVAKPHDCSAENIKSSKLLSNKEDKNPSSDALLTSENSHAKPVMNFSNLVSEREGSYSKHYSIKKGKALGEGSYGKVLEATNKTTKLKTAIKVIKKQFLASESQLINEIEILKKLDHPNILKIFEYYQDSRNYYIVMELCDGKDLVDTVLETGFLSERDSALILKQIIRGLLYAHNHGIVHRDIKPENILAERSQEGGFIIKIVDWGTAKILAPSERLKGRIGTPYYVAPEVLSKTYNEKCDIWSCGVLLFVLLSGYPPFDGESNEIIFQKVRKGILNFDEPEWAQISNEAKDLISKMMIVDPNKRLNAQGVVDHAWFKLLENSEANPASQIVLNNLQNLKNFAVKNRLQQGVLTFIAMQLTKKQELENLKKIFKSLDKNDDGLLSKEEIKQGYSRIMGEEEAEVEAERIMEQVDTNNSGFIDYTEFVAASMEVQNMQSSTNLRAAFNVFDRDGNGFITIDELKSTLGGQLSEIDDKLWEEIMKDVDENGDGNISFEEFTKLMKQFGEKH